MATATGDSAGAPPTPGSLELVSIKPVVFGGVGQPYNKLLIADVSFEALDVSALGTVPKVGAWSLAGDAAMRSEISKIALASDLYSGSAIVIAGGKPDFVLTQSSATIPANDVPAKLMASMTAKADAGDELAFRVQYESKGEALEQIRAVPGGGEWRTVAIEEIWQAGEVPPTVTVSVLRRGIEEGNATVKTVSAILITTDAPAPGFAGRELLANGDFEERGWSRSFAPWFYSNWGGNPGKTVTVTTDPSSPERGYVASLPQPDANPGGLSLVQTVSGLDASVRGKTLKVVVLGKSSAPGQLGIAVKYTLSTGEQRLTQMHNGDGTWQGLAATATLPAGEAPPNVRLEVFRNAGADGAVYFDGASLRIE
ncbi:MAG: hypothetical protein HUU46_09535 [Candidatus Hydrogenedentes bacterium]|nr:hypothetical protein [Candidatus Hydrogenedentota bacterium]